MGWTRVRCQDYKEINLPPVCPNCLQEIPEAATIGAGYGGPCGNVVSWPVCAKCRDAGARVKRRALFLGVIPGVLAGVLGVVGAFAFENGMVWMWIGFLAAVCLPPLGYAFAGIVALFEPLNGRATRFRCLLLNRGGPKTLSDSYYLDMYFKNAAYVEKLVEANPHLTMRVG